KVEWDEEISNSELRASWTQWEQELIFISQVSLPRHYIKLKDATYQLHVFCDSSEKAYGAVSYLRGERDGKVETAFVIAKSKVAPRKQLSMPRLELCAALIGAKLIDFLVNTLTIPVSGKHLWSDSTTVLTWITSETCRFKVFVGTRVAEILHLTDGMDWHYVPTAENVADDITRGMSLRDIASNQRWQYGPSFLTQAREHWPVMPNLQDCPKCDAEIKKSVFSGLVGINVADSEIDELKNFEKLILYLGQRFNGAAPQQLENEAWKMVQLCCFPEEVRALKAGSPLPTGSRLKQLSPEWDKDTGLLRVGGRLREANAIQEQMKHPIILDPKHHITKILVRHTDVKLLHPGPERVLAELRRRYWILRGREVVKGQQRQCQECQRWSANPSNPQMRDLPAARLQLFKPVFHCTGIDCFGPMHIKVGRRTEKRWGIVYKCMTVGAVQLELLDSMDTDAFLLSLRRFISRRGQPAKIYSDCGTNFKSGDKSRLRSDDC
ncbi:uncharacterized protein LOC117100323, partial [Anneissia japonica]|uniref:uncharacterized protein LOC117100323 n=1 Tax=Anneissia japonica TaxID=1529436 RepID=UPI0014256322